MTDPLVLLPFEADLLGTLPTGLRVRTAAEPWTSADLSEVEFYVPPYTFDARAADAIQQMPRLRVVQSLSAGIEHLRPFVPEGVTLCRGLGIHETATAELALTLTLASLRGVPESAQAQLRHEWPENEWRPGLADKRVLLVGYGAIGEAIERRLEPFEVDITRVARSPRDGVHAIGDLPALVADADVIVLIIPGTTETRGLFDRELISRMRPGALLVNVARGPVVQTEALVEALGEGRIRAALDVTDPEPLPPDHPLWDQPNLLITPHVGGASDAMWPRAHAVIRQQLERWSAGEELVGVVRADY